MNNGTTLDRCHLFIRVFGGNYGYECPVKHPNGFVHVVHYRGWRPNILRLTWKWWREGWHKLPGNGQRAYGWREFCWRLPHEENA